MRCYQQVIICLLLTVGLCPVMQTPGISAQITELPISSIYAPRRPRAPIHEVMASWYGRRFAGRATTSGELFDPHRLTAASITIPLGSVVKVENPQNGRSVKVRINDCGPFVRGRSLDLSFGAAHRIGMDKQGIARLRVTPIKIPRDANEDRCCE
jgi:rare lipoprotein A (peptidoglycan hydrolase)